MRDLLWNIRKTRLFAGGHSTAERGILGAIYFRRFRESRARHNSHDGDNSIVPSIASCPALASCRPAPILTRLQPAGRAISGEAHCVFPQNQPQDSLKCFAKRHARIREAKRKSRPGKEVEPRCGPLGGPGQEGRVVWRQTHLKQLPRAGENTRRSATCRGVGGDELVFLACRLLLVLWRNLALQIQGHPAIGTWLRVSLRLRLAQPYHRLDCPTKSCSLEGQQQISEDAT